MPSYTEVRSLEGTVVAEVLEDLAASIVMDAEGLAIADEFVLEKDSVRFRVHRGQEEIAFVSSDEDENEGQETLAKYMKSLRNLFGFAEQTGGARRYRKRKTVRRRRSHRHTKTHRRNRRR
jgi:hypothetical protein